MKPKDWAYFAKNYEKKMISLSCVPERQKQIIKEIKPGKVLNIGCGCITGLNQALIKKGNIVIATDFCKPMLKEAKKRFDNKNLKYVVANSSNLPFEKNGLDSVIAVNSILTDNREESNKIAKEVYRVLKSKGKFVAFLCSYECNKEIVEKLKVKNIFLKDKKFMVGTEKDGKKIFQCFHSPKTIETMMRYAGFSKFKYRKVINNTDQEIKMIKKVHNIAGCVFYTYFLIAEK